MIKILLKAALIIFGLICVYLEFLNEGGLMFPLLISLLCLTVIYIYEFFERKEMKEGKDR